ncbi:MAG: bacillithiol biosynthesis deacetylase BshB1, partial [Synechococcaceae bacterium WB7_1C_051]|nr:bacillithiol biosynthesis deacetylase BshB1 [Synechococcaceae bacterium WB7_1C_051]
MQVDILAFGAHPDDIEISCGGTLLRYRSEGKNIAIV